METKKRKRTSTKKDTKAKPKKVKQESDDEFEEKEIPDIEDTLSASATKTFLCTHNDSYHQFKDNEIQSIRGQLLQWYDENKRDLPWRNAEVKNGEDDQMDEEVMKMMDSKGTGVNKERLCSLGE